MIRTVVGLTVMAAGLLSAQAPSPAAADPPVILKSATRLVQVSVIVQDKKGQPVADLAKEDFQVKVNGKVQPLKVFSVASNRALPRSEESLPPGFYTNRVEANQSPSSVTIILMDTRNTSFADQVYAKAQIVKYLRTLEPNEHLGLYTLGSGLRVLHDYTADSAEFLRRLETSKNNALPDTARGEPNGALGNDALLLDSWTRAAGGVSGAERDFYTVDRVLTTLRAMEFIANHLAELPGRKNLVWVSGGFPLEIGFDSLDAWRDPSREQRSFTAEVEHTVRAMNDANIAVYPVDARGLMVDPGMDASRASLPRRNAIAPPIGFKNQSTMLELASRTGGEAYYNRNDIAGAIHAAVDDARVTYTLGFYPQDETFDGMFHKIEVRLPEHGELKLRYRKGYFDLGERPQNDQVRKAELRAAVWSPLDASALGLVGRVRPAPSKPGSLEVMLKVDHSEISLEEQADRWVGRLDILFVQRDDHGKEFNGVNDTLNLNLHQTLHDRLTKEDLVYNKVIPRATQATVLRLVVRDAASGALGSLTVPLGK